MKNANWKLPLIIIASVIAVIIAGVFWVQSSQDRAYTLEEQVITARKDLDNALKSRVDLVYNLADCVMQYDTHEAETLKELATNMSNGVDVENVQNAIASVTYAYPELKSVENYNMLMNELTKLENTIKTHRDNYNSSVEKYNKYTRMFVNRMRLNWLGYERIDFPNLELNVTQDAPQNLFNR